MMTAKYLEILAIGDVDKKFSILTPRWLQSRKDTGSGTKSQYV